jgi:hypothetical protein
MMTETPINDLPIYLERMGRSVFDKLFAFDVGADVYVDFGCADGMLLKLACFPRTPTSAMTRIPR